MKRYYLFFLAHVICHLLGAWDWPDSPVAVKSFFSHPRAGHFGRGLEFEASDGGVKSWSDGELIWFGNSMGKDSSPSEPMVVLEHENDFRTIYHGLEKLPRLGTKIAQNQLLGYSHNTTWWFEIQDTSLSRIVNPIILLPTRETTWIQDNLKAYLMRDNELVKLQDNLLVKLGDWSLVLEGDIPMQVSLFWIGKKIASISFDALAEHRGSVVLQTPETFTYKDIYDEYGRLTLRNIPLSAGNGILELRMENVEDTVYHQSWKLLVEGR